MSVLVLLTISACAKNNTSLQSDSLSAGDGFSCVASPSVVSARNGELATIQIQVTGATATLNYVKSSSLTTNPQLLVNTVEVNSSSSVTVSRAYEASTALSFQDSITLIDGSAAANSTAAQATCSFQVNLQP